MGKPSGNRRQPRTYQEVIRRIRDGGYTITPVGGHNAVLRPNGTLLMKFGSSPSKQRDARQTWMSFQKAVNGGG